MILHSPPEPESLGGVMEPNHNSVAVEQVRMFALRKMEEYGVSDWKFRINNNRSRLGVCRPTQRTIELSIFHARQGLTKEVVNTILHEIAHAMVGCHHMHDDVWRKQFIAMGGNGERCGVMEAPKKFTGECRNCGKEYRTNRRMNSACGVCCKRMNNGKFHASFAIVWKPVL